MLKFAFFFMPMQQRLALPLSFVRNYITRRARAPTGTAERPPYRAPDPLANNPNVAVKSLGDDLTFIHRPPPTAPTPFSLTTAPASPLLRPRPSLGCRDIPLPPFLRPSAERPEPGRVSEETIREIRLLRHSKPRVYSRGRLAKMFGCTETFVARVAALRKPERKALVKEREARHERVREGWGERKGMVRAVRAKRREYW